MLRLTDPGRQRLEAVSGYLLQDHVLQRLAEMPPEQRRQLLESLEELAGLLDAEGLDASPMLHPEGSLTDDPPPGPP